MPLNEEKDLLLRTSVDVFRQKRRNSDAENARNDHDKGAVDDT